MKKDSLPSSILILMEDIWKLSQNLNIYNCYHVYRETNRTTDCLAKKGICNIYSNIWWSDFPRDVRKFSFEDHCGSSFNRLCIFPYL